MFGAVQSSTRWGSCHVYHHPLKKSQRHDMSHLSHVLSICLSRLRNDLYCVEWDVKLYYTLPYSLCLSVSVFFSTARSLWLQKKNKRQRERERERESNLQSSPFFHALSPYSSRSSYACWRPTCCCSCHYDLILTSLGYDLITEDGEDWGVLRTP